jgi:Zn-dependent protease
VIPNFSSSSGTDVTQRNELLEFAKAWLGTALAFAVLFSSGQRDGLQFFLTSEFATVLLLAALTAGLGVILHELMHRVVARYFGATAHFVANDSMLVISILIAFTGFLFAAPGAVWHTGYLTKRQVGLIAAAGPVTNMVLAILFLGALVVAQGSNVSSTVIFGLFMGFQVNGILGVFNMLPFGPIDGAKIMAWSGPVFGVLIAVAIGIGFGLPRLFGLPAVFG